MSTTKKSFTFIFTFFLLQMYSQDIVTDRPDQTESSSTVGKRNFQIEMGISTLNIENQGISSFLGPSTLLRYGITEGIELRFASQYESTKVEIAGDDFKNKGFNDLEFGVKIQVFKRKDINTEIAFLSHIIIPTANKKLTTNTVGVINKLAISHELTNKLSIGYNVGYDYIEEFHSFTYSLVLGISISKVVGLYVEPYGFWGESNVFENNFDAGFTFLLNPNFQLDTSYGIGLSNTMQYFSIGFSWRINQILVKKQ